MTIDRVPFCALPDWPGPTFGWDYSSYVAGLPWPDAISPYRNAEFIGVIKPRFRMDAEGRWFFMPQQ